MTDTSPRDDIQVIKKALVRFNEQAWGIAIGLLLGLALFATTNWLIVKGGPSIGPHLSLLGNFLPGYRVTFLGSLIGFVYLFVIGYGIGRTIGTVYNWLITPSQDAR
jgi:hypothetical protein